MIAADGRPAGAPGFEPDGAPRLATFRGSFQPALAVDVEEWYHTCHIPEFVDPARRPHLAEELDRLLPELLATLAAAGRRATFFILGEVAARLPARVREIHAAGHEVACHGFLHLRAGDRRGGEFLDDLRRARGLLEDLVGAAVPGYRAPEWSLRHPGHPHLRLVARAGFRYDSSLAPCLGSGRRTNPLHPYVVEWPDGERLIEAPPLTFAGPARLPACGWTGRLAGAATVLDAARLRQAAGGLPVWTVHPWEVNAGPTPGELTGLARFLHETARRDLAAAFPGMAAALPWTTLVAALAPPGGAGPSDTTETHAFDA